MEFSSDKCYVLGLLLGGGELSRDNWIVAMPFNKWGLDPRNATKIAKNILTVIRHRFKSAYDIDIDFSPSGKIWHLRPLKSESIDQIRADLHRLHLPSTGVLIDHASVKYCKSVFTDAQASAFLAGIFDARASVEVSHRRHTMSAPIVSLEIPGRTSNFELVVGLCSWLTQRGSITDQILYNHPSQHSPADPQYKGWRKGFKIRLLAKTFLRSHQFVLHPKCDQLTKLAASQRSSEQLPCKDRVSSKQLGAVAIHRDVGCPEFPAQVRNEVFLHYHHICAAMGCPFAPIDEVQKMVTRADELVSSGPRCIKSDSQGVEVQWRAAVGEPGEMKTRHITVAKLLEMPDADQYPDLKVGLAYLLAPTLNGKRHRGKASDIINQALEHDLVLRAPIKGGNSLMISNLVLGRAIILSRSGGAVTEGAVYVDGIRIIVKES